MKISHLTVLSRCSSLVTLRCLLLAVIQISRWMEALPSSTCDFSAQVMLGIRRSRQRREKAGRDCMEVLFMGQAWNTALLSTYNCLNLVTWPCRMQRTLGNVVLFTRKRRNTDDLSTSSATISTGRVVITGNWQPTQVENIPVYLPFRWSS